jgi:predicted enzyme related to lactoylglutathione lyase
MHMPETAVAAPGTVNWVDISSRNVEASKTFYSKLFGWQPETVPDPQAGGYTFFKLNGKQVSALGPTQSEQQPPSAWSIYFATDDADATAKKVKDAGGKVISEPFDVMGVGRMAVFQDPTGAFFSVWQPGQHKGFELSNQPSAYAWAELNTRGIDKATSFYQKVFGWGVKKSPMGEGQGDYTEFQIDGNSIAGGYETQQPPEVPPHWLVYFAADDPDATTKKVAQLGGKVMLEPQDFPGGRFAIASDPQGGAFGILRMTR